jgi:hypothetical protein
MFLCSQPLVIEKPWFVLRFSFCFDLDGGSDVSFVFLPYFHLCMFVRSAWTGAERAQASQYELFRTCAGQRAGVSREAGSPCSRTTRSRQCGVTSRAG